MSDWGHDREARPLRRESAGYNWGVLFLWGVALYLVADWVLGGRSPDWLVPLILYPNWFAQKTGLVHITAPFARLVLQLVYMPAEFIAFAYPLIAFPFLGGLMYAVAERRRIPIISSAVSVAGFLLYPACIADLACSVYESRALACETARDVSCAAVNRHKAELFEPDPHRREELASLSRAPNAPAERVVPKLAPEVDAYLREACDADLDLPPDWGAERAETVGVAFHPPSDASSAAFVMSCQDNLMGAPVGPLTCAGNAGTATADSVPGFANGRLVKLSSGADACSFEILDGRDRADALSFSLGDRVYSWFSFHAPDSGSHAEQLAEIASSVRRRPPSDAAAPTSAPIPEQLVVVDERCGLKLRYPASWQKEPSAAGDGPSVQLTRRPAFVATKCTTLPSMLPPLSRLSIPLYLKALPEGPWTWGEAKLLDLAGVRAMRVEGTSMQESSEVRLEMSSVTITVVTDAKTTMVVGVWPTKAPLALSREVEGIISQLEIEPASLQALAK